jgi:steroid delta-isomerase-like uncharacterized protein
MAPRRARSRAERRFYARYRTKGAPSTLRLAALGPACQHVRVELAENKALVRRYYDEVLTGRDRDLLARLLDPSFVSHVPGGPDVGADAYMAAVEATYAAFPALVVTVHDQVAEGDKVVTRWSASGTHAGDFAGVPATGRLVTVTGIHIHRVQHGRLVEHWEELNLLGVLRQLGVWS